jgi:hypothetical protein
MHKFRFGQVLLVGLLIKIYTKFILHFFMFIQISTNFISLHYCVGTYKKEETRKKRKIGHGPILAHQLAAPGLHYWVHPPGQVDRGPLCPTVHPSEAAHEASPLPSRLRCRQALGHSHQGGHAPGAHGGTFAGRPPVDEGLGTGHPKHRWCMPQSPAILWRWGAQRKGGSTKERSSSPASGGDRRRILIGAAVRFDDNYLELQTEGKRKLDMIGARKGWKGPWVVALTEAWAKRQCCCEILGKKGFGVLGLRTKQKKSVRGSWRHSRGEETWHRQGSHQRQWRKQGGATELEPRPCEWRKKRGGEGGDGLYG